MDAVTRQAFIVARELDGADWGDVPVEAVAAWARYARPVLRDLVRYLDDIAALEDDTIDDDGPDHTPKPTADDEIDWRELCPGSGQYVAADQTDGNGVGRCRTCLRDKATDPFADSWRVFRDHRSPVMWRQG